MAKSNKVSNLSALSKKMSIDKILMIVLIIVVLVAAYYFMAKSNVSENFSNKLENKDKASFVMFYADWCPHCQNAKPIVNDLKEEVSNDNQLKKNVEIVNVNCEEEKELANKYKISGYPTFKLIKDSEVVEYEGGADKDQFMSFLKNNV
jgi:thiol-disulfide isomerase/thioredoxin